MARLLLFLGVAVGLYLLFRWLSNQPPRVYWQLTATLLAIGLLLMVAMGRAHWIMAIFAGILPFIRSIISLLGAIPLLKRALAGIDSSQSTQDSNSAQTSTVQSKYIRMTLEHDSGDIDGEVLEGSFKGRMLKQLNLDNLLQLLRECQDDEESVALLQTYLDREYGDEWQQQAGAQQQQTPSESGNMSYQEALQILGLSSDPSKEQIIETHRRLIQKLHPDRGGSAYLAAKINLAKDTLLSN